jgi:tetratricopeptide (TPR) repeat protein
MVLLKKGLVTVAALAALTLGLAAQDKKKEWKDRAEYDLYDAALKDLNANVRLETLEKWKKQYTQSDYADVRLQIYLVTYRQLNRVREAFDTAAEILKDNPNHVVALATIVGSLYLLNPASAADLETAERTCTSLLGNLDTIYGPEKRPADTKEADWIKAKPEMKVFAQKTLGWIYWTRKDMEKAEAELTKALQLDPSQGQASYWLASAILAQNKTNPEKQPLALFHYARAAAYEGAGSLPGNDRKQIQAYLAKVYAQYHGSDDGLDQLMASAKTSALPPAAFQILSAGEVMKARQEAEEAAARANPMLALWRSIRSELAGDKGASYFESSMKDAILPGGVNRVEKFKGKLVSMTPAVRPKELVLAIEDGEPGDVTLKLDGPLQGKMEPGSEIEFQGVARAFTKEPFMVTFEVEKAEIVGWTGRNEVLKKSTGAKKSGGANGKS